MFSTDLNREYKSLAEQGFTWKELWRLNLNAVDASFLDEDQKAAYRKEWQEWKNSGMTECNLSGHK